MLVMTSIRMVYTPHSRHAMFVAVFVLMAAVMPLAALIDLHEERFLLLLMLEEKSLRYVLVGHGPICKTRRDPSGINPSLSGTGAGRY